MALDGSGSIGPVVSYLWTQLAGIQAYITDPSAAVTTIRLPDFYIPPSTSFQLTFELAVTDALGGTSRDTVVLQMNTDAETE